jgi:hypothetical protein
LGCMGGSFSPIRFLGRRAYMLLELTMVRTSWGRFNESTSAVIYKHLQAGTSILI